MPVWSRLWLCMQASRELLVFDLESKATLATVHELILFYSSFLYPLTSPFSF